MKQREGQQRRQQEQQQLQRRPAQPRLPPRCPSSSLLRFPAGKRGRKRRMKVARAFFFCSWRPSLSLSFALAFFFLVSASKSSDDRRREKKERRRLLLHFFEVHFLSLSSLSLSLSQRNAMRLSLRATMTTTTASACPSSRSSSAASRRPAGAAASRAMTFRSTRNDDAVLLFRSSPAVPTRKTSISFVRAQAGDSAAPKAEGDG